MTSQVSRLIGQLLRIFPKILKIGNNLILIAVNSII
jgi:hypothetical protein